MKKNVWEALSDSTRREILKLLKLRPHTAGELADQFSLSPATVSHHISVLKESGLITGERRAQTIDREWKALCMLEMTIDQVSGKEAIELVKERCAP